MCVCVCVCVCLFVCLFVCVCVCVCVRARAYMFMFAYLFVFHVCLHVYNMSYFILQIQHKRRPPITNGYACEQTHVYTCIHTYKQT